MHPFDTRLAAIERTQHGLVALHQLKAEWKTGIIRRRVLERRLRSAPRVYVNASVASSPTRHACSQLSFRQVPKQLRHTRRPRDSCSSRCLAPQRWRSQRRTGADHSRMVRGCIGPPGSTRAMSPRSTEIPVTAAGLTIYSLSSRLSIGQLGRITDDALRRGLLNLDDLVEVVERVSPANGRSRKKMRAMLERRVAGA